MESLPRHSFCRELKVEIPQGIRAAHSAFSPQPPEDMASCLELRTKESLKVVNHSLKAGLGNSLKGQAMNIFKIERLGSLCYNYLTLPCVEATTGSM